MKLAFSKAFVVALLAGFALATVAQAYAERYVKGGTTVRFSSPAGVKAETTCNHKLPNKTGTRWLNRASYLQSVAFCFSPNGSYVGYSVSPLEKPPSSKTWVSAKCPSGTINQLGLGIISD